MRMNNEFRAPQYVYQYASDARVRDERENEQVVQVGQESSHCRVGESSSRPAGYLEDLLRPTHVS